MPRPVNKEEKMLSNRQMSVEIIESGFFQDDPRFVANMPRPGDTQGTMLGNRQMSVEIIEPEQASNSVDIFNEAMLTSMDLEDLLNGLDENDNEMWSMLATLHETQDDTTPLQDTTPNSSIIDTLRDRFFYEPQDFTERLVTIIEQSVMEDAIANNSRFNSSFMKLINEACCADIPLIQDESLPISFANTESEGYSCSNSINLGRRVRLASPMCSSPDIMKIKFNKRQKKGINPATPVDTSRLAIPRVHLTPGTPIDSSPNQLTIEHDEEYLTAESETDESNDFETDNEGAKFNDNLNMSMVKYCHAQWLQSFALYEPKVSRRKSSANNSELAEFRDNLMRKRTKCFQVVKSLIDQNGRIALTSEMNKDCHSRQRLSTDGFCTTIEACNEYRRFITNNDDTLKKNKKTDSRFVSSATIKVTMKQSPRLCTKKRRTSVRSSVRKSPVTSKSRVVSPRSTSPLVDQTRIRPVAQLRTIFSPTRRVYPPRPVSTQHATHSRNRKSPKPVASTKSPRLKNVKSPVGEYIRGKKILP